METLVTRLRQLQKEVGGGAAVARWKAGGLIGDAASRIEDLEDHVLRLEDQLATRDNDIKGLKGRPHRD